LKPLPKLTIAVVAATLLAACASAPLPPKVELPAASAPTPANIERWWTLFDDPQLTALIDEALANNLELRLAVARIEESRASLRLARQALSPSLDVDAGVNRSQVSNANTRQLPPPLATTTHNLGLQAAYEIDLWGRLAAGRDAAGADLLATAYAAQTVRIALAAQVATSAFTLRALDAELQLTRDTLATREASVELQQRRFDAGVASEYDLALARAERSTVAAGIAPIEQAVAQAESALAALLGRSAKAVFTPEVSRGAKSPAEPGVAEVPAGLPSDLLARRPDIRQAEAQLAAADARVAQARAAYYPRLSLTASLGGESRDLADLLTAPARVWSIAGNLLQPILGLKTIEAQADAAAARREQAVLAYQQVVQSAFRDVHDALVAHRGARDSLAAQDERRQRLREALRLAELRLQAGYSSQLEVLDAQRNLLDAERARLNALRDRQIALVSLYKALGGGWQMAELAAAR
jgi:multidrug efflux system outer membrane protein